MSRSTPLKLRFNKALIEGLEPADPPADRYYVYDAATPTLCVCVTSTGVKTFYRYGRIAGEPTREKLGRWPNLTVENARTAVARLNGSIASGNNPAEERRAIRSSMTLGELWDFYLATFAKPHKRSWRTDLKLWNGYLAVWSNRRLCDVKRADVLRLHGELGQNSIYNANRTRSLLQTMINRAIDAGYEGENPVARVKPFPEMPRERFFSVDEVGRLFESLDKEPNQIPADAIRFAILTGARRSNWMQCRWDEIDLVNRVWTIPANKAKGKKQIVVPLADAAFTLLKRRVVASEYVFPGSQDGHIASPRELWDRIRKAAGLQDARMHDLRRTNATFAVSAGVPLLHVSRLLGHKTSVITESVYARLQDGSLRSAADVVGAAITAAAQPAKPKAKRKGSITITTEQANAIGGFYREGDELTPSMLNRLMRKAKGGGNGKAR